jgi:predicted GNAT family N-acyltransferase
MNGHFGQVEKIKTDIELFKSAFRTLYEEGIITDFSEVAGVELGVKSPEDLSEEDRDAMRAMYDSNYGESSGYSPEFRETIFHGLDEAFTKKEGARFYVLKKEGKLIGYNRFEDLPDTEDGRHRKYVGSFNVSPEYRGSKLGDKMFDDCLAQETGNETIVEAYADPTLPITSHYLETNGFVATGIEDVGGRPLLRIVRDPELNAKLSTKLDSFSEAIAEELAKNGSPKDTVFAKTTTLSELSGIVTGRFEDGWVLTRVIRTPTGSGSVTAVFEKKHG